LFQPGTFLKHKKYPNRVWIALEVTPELFETTPIDVPFPGVYAFGGMWYGENYLDINSFGKVLYLENISEFTIVKDNDVTIEALKS